MKNRNKGNYKLLIKPDIWIAIGIICPSWFVIFVGFIPLAISLLPQNTSEITDQVLCEKIFSSRIQSLLKSSIFTLALIQP